MTPAVKILIITNVVLFVLNVIVGDVMTLRLGLSPQAVFEQLRVLAAVHLHVPAQHGGIGHILINMLSLWMFGTELERTWGTRFFTKYYFDHRRRRGGDQPAAVDVRRRHLLLADGRRVGRDLRPAAGYGMYFPKRPIYLYFIFPIPARYFVMIVGAIAFFSAVGGPGGGVAHSAHLGGLVVGYLY